MVGRGTYSLPASLTPGNNFIMRIEYSGSTLPSDGDVVVLVDPHERDGGSTDPTLMENWRLIANSSASGNFVGQDYIIGAYSGTVITYQKSYSTGLYYWMRLARVM